MAYVRGGRDASDLTKVFHIEERREWWSRYLPGWETYCLTGLGKFNIDGNCSWVRKPRVGGELDEGALVRHMLATSVK